MDQTAVSKQTKPKKKERAQTQADHPIDSAKEKVVMVRESRRGTEKKERTSLMAKQDAKDTCLYLCEVIAILSSKLKMTLIEKGGEIM